MKTIQKIKCKLGWHKWFYGYLAQTHGAIGVHVPYKLQGYSDVEIIAIRTCSYHCWRVETINAATGGWDRLLYNEDIKLWERVESD